MAESVQKIEMTDAVFSQEEVSALLDSLSCEALTKLGRIARWLAIRRSISADDLLQEAVVRTLDGVRKCPRDVTLETFLYGVMRSIVSASTKTAISDPLSLRPYATDDEEDDALALVKSESRDPLQLLVAAEDVNRMLANLAEMFSDDPTTELVVLGLCQDMTPEEIRKDLNLDETGYATIRRRIRRRIDKRYPNGWEL